MELTTSYKVFMKKKVAVIVGSDSDLPVVKEDINTNNKMRLRGIYVCRNV